ncbi:coiled-coil domain-containing protein 47-like [Hippocampus comes]|uniref:coiled-coil domain-containing protein 47-like n=1 Tax=Hippocampus comes TaxID=109280 RepID=UPI00094E1F81|nr:PREDICTED: coiled-coil domain-containing protein 47-like [Hippocampus comes]
MRIFGDCLRADIVTRIQQEGSGSTMRHLSILLLPLFLLLLAFPVSGGRYNDDFDDGEDLADFDDNDFAEFEDMSDDAVPEAGTAPPPARGSPSLRPDEDEDENEATVELEDGQDGFDDSDAQDQDIYSKYDQEEFEGIGDMEKTGHPMKDPLIIHTVNLI